MPVYNEEACIEEALGSVFAQYANFEYELIIVNDGSTDRTAEIIKDYQQLYPQIRYIEFSQNRGAAFAACAAVESAQGEYFLVLDGDDYLLHSRKLQRQVDFLDRHPDHIAVTHNFLRLENDVFELGRTVVDEQKSFGIEDGYLGLGYFHTATYMFRNIFKGKVPSFWKEDGAGSCDNIRLMTCLALTEKKVRALNFVGSVYRYNGEGIWSSLPKKAQAEELIARRRIFLRSGILKNAVLAKSISEHIADSERLLRKALHPDSGVRLNSSFEGFHQAAALMVSFVPPFSLFSKPKRRARYMARLGALQTPHFK